MQIRRVTPDEWEVLRDVRLAALADTPDAFGTTVDEALARPEEWWVSWTLKSATSDKQAMFLARDGTAAVGIAGIFWDEEEGPFWRVISMWVDPAVRGRAAGRALLDAAVSFARIRGGNDVRLSVTDGNVEARSLYERYGFVDTGVTEPLRPDSELTMRELRLEQ